jgi:hypothetical protein
MIVKIVFFLGFLVCLSVFLSVVSTDLILLKFFETYLNHDH